MTKITDGITRIVRQQKPVVADFDGNDALLRDPIELKQEIQSFAQGSMPEVLRRVYAIVTDEQRSPKDVIQAAKFIKSVADGQVPKVKVINGIVKKLSVTQLNTDLNGTDDE